MALFLAAADETEASGTWLHAGFVAPVSDWIDWFAPAWEERVLQGPPPIPHLHMVDIRSEAWRSDHGISLSAAERRVDEATRIINSLGTLFLVSSTVDAKHFRDRMRSKKIIRPTTQPAVYRFDPDYMSYLGFTFGVLHYVHSTHPEAEKVDFMFERKQDVTRRLEDFHSTLPAALQNLGEGHLGRLLGDLIPGGKDRVPLQAADLACWHIQRVNLGDPDRSDYRRYERISSRLGRNFGWDQKDIEGLAERWEAANVPTPFQAKRNSRPA